jgi:hypothetical protein
VAANKKRLIASIDVHMGRIRMAIEDDHKAPERILTVRGVGVCFCQTTKVTLTMSWLAPVAKHLYLRIWLAVVAGVAVLMLLVGWAWSLSVEHVAHNGPQGPRESQVRNEQGEVIQSVPGNFNAASVLTLS